MRASLGVGIFAANLVTTAAMAAYPECPPVPATPAAISEWREGAVKAVDGEYDGDTAVADAISRCFGTTVPTCLQKVQNYSLRYDVATSYDEPKFDAVPQKQPPQELLAPKELLPANATGSAYVIPETIEGIAKSKGWLAVRYKSRHAGGFDPATPSLLMVYVPGDKVDPPVSFDRWLNFALPPDEKAHELNPTPQQPVPNAASYAAEAQVNGPELPRTFTMVSLEKPANGLAAQVFFQKFERTGYGSPLFTPEKTSSVQSCYACHPNGLRAISPLGYHVRAGEASLPTEAWQTVRAINDAMEDGANSKLVSWREASADGGAVKPLLRPKSYWPIVGPARPFNKISRTKEFIMGGTTNDGRVLPGCYKAQPRIDVTDIFDRPPGRGNIFKLNDTPTVDWEKIASAMNCESCHNNRGRGAITSRINFDQVAFKILVDQSMPFGMHENPLDQSGDKAQVIDELTPDERIALTNCLDAEITEEASHRSDYLLKDSCG